MKIVIGIIIGATLGFVVAYFGKCVSGTCPLTNNPLFGAIIGAFLGALFILGK